LERLAAPHQMGARAMHEHLGSARAGVVVRAHHHAVRASREDCQQVALARREAPLPGEEVGTLADRPDHVIHALGRTARAHGAHFVPRVIERRPDQVVHRRIDDQERSEEHTSELQSRGHLVCRLLLEKKKNKKDRRKPSQDKIQLKKLNADRSPRTIHYQQEQHYTELLAKYMTSSSCRAADRHTTAV